MNDPFVCFTFRKRVALPYWKVIQITWSWIFFFNYFNSFISHFLTNLPLKALCKEGLNICEALLIYFYSKLCSGKWNLSILSQSLRYETFFNVCNLFLLSHYVCLQFYHEQKCTAIQRFNRNIRLHTLIEIIWSN